MSLTDYVFLGIDAVALAFVFSEYRVRSRAVEAISNAPVVTLSRSANESISNLPDGCLPYAVVEGTVKAMGQPLRSSHDSRITGVIKKDDILEHRIRWSWAARWWMQEKSSVSSSRSSVPFVLENRAHDAVEIIDATSVADTLLTTVYDGFQARSASLWSSIGAFFTGRQLTGHEYVEQMLTEGSRVTAVGTLVSVREGRNLYLQMRPPAGNADSTPALPFILSRNSITSVIDNLRDDARTYKKVAIILAATGVALAVRVLVVQRRDRLRREAARRDHEKLLQAVEEARRKRAESGVEGEPEVESNPCVICLTNPREVLILECGHLCCCLRCGEALTPALCPMCRRAIRRLVPAYIS